MTKAAGQSAADVEAARRMPMWPALEAMAHTLAYDSLVLGGERCALPVDMLATVAAPLLSVHSTASPPWLTTAAEALAKAVPNGRSVGLPGEFHQVPAATLAPVLTEFWLS